MTKLIRDIGYFAILCLMIIGVVGIMYHAIGKDGWIAQLMSGLVTEGVGTILGVLAGIIAAGWLARRWLIATQTNVLFNDFLMYGLVAVGLFFLGRVMMQGSL